MLYFVLALLLIGCDYSSQQPKYTPIICNNLICFPNYIDHIGPDFDTRDECEKYIEGKTDPNDMKFAYCKEN